MFNEQKQIKLSLLIFSNCVSLVFVFSVDVCSALLYSLFGTKGFLVQVLAAVLTNRVQGIHTKILHKEKADILYRRVDKSVHKLFALGKSHSTQNVHMWTYLILHYTLTQLAITAKPFQILIDIYFNGQDGRGASNWRKHKKLMTVTYVNTVSLSTGRHYTGFSDMKVDAKQKHIAADCIEC